jgi:hypothetical protein
VTRVQVNEAPGTVWEWVGGAALVGGGAALVGARESFSDKPDPGEDLANRDVATVTGAAGLVAGAVLLGMATYHSVRAVDDTLETRTETRTLEQRPRECGRPAASFAANPAPGAPLGSANGRGHLAGSAPDSAVYNRSPSIARKCPSCV